ncbi:hypothetical protein AEGHOMDF_2687 [Methylobacterium soli]|nr:hypothetical protein AEGHOMDF_2687 [Methylobacterium soli]
MTSKLIRTELGPDFAWCSVADVTRPVDGRVLIR